MICGRCGHTNRPDAQFCEECGNSLAPRCRSCGAEVSPTARYCSSCGAPIADEPVATGALKVVSVVFSDLVGSTALQETLQPESVRRVMARFYEAMRSVVAAHGGSVEKFIGDAVVAVFGVPSVSEDDALRAVRCASAMATALTILNEEVEQTWGVRLDIRTGVNTGELAISGGGILVGDTMNTAARLEQAADAGQVLVGETTWRLVRHEVELEEIAPLALKGKSEAVRVWRVVSTQPRGAAAAEAPLVGRASELERLRAALEEAVAARACRLVTVIGSPGLGKSRLATEFARSLQGQATVLEGHCQHSGEGITFLPVADVLRAAASIADDDPPEQVIAKLAAAVPQGPDRERVVARVAGLLGAGPPAAPEETFWGVRTLLESLARERPLVVVLDDVHWGQPMFLDLLEHLVEWARDAAILVVALARPELRESRAALTAPGRRAMDVIEVDPLEPEQSRELVGGLLGQVDVPDELLERILETTDGNPLFLGELLRMLVDEGSLERDGEVWVAAGGAETVQVPPTIQALLTARIERLRAEERSVVERAAVIGKQFYRGAVAELVAPPVRSGIDVHLETLRRKEMVEPEGTYWIDEPVYRFHHVLIRDAAYHLLLKEARAELHEKFADWLDTKAGELVGEHEEVIAYHLEQAHEYRRQLGPLDERGKAVGARAAERLASAGQRALAREDLAAAANLLQRAVDREAGISEEEVMWHLAEALLSAGDTAGATQVVWRLSGPRAEVLAAQLAVLTGSGSLDRTLERVTAATAELAARGDAVAEAKGHHVTAQVQAQLGRVAEVETSLDQALLGARKADDRRRITAVLAAAPRAALWGPSPVVRASGRCLDVVRILRMTPGNRHVEAVALRCQAVLEAMRGRADAAREILDGGRATLEELGLTLELHELAMHAGIVELLAGQPRSAEELLRSARDGFGGLGVSVSAAQAAALLARALVEQGRDEDALAETEYAEQHAGGDLKTTITWLGVRAEALARRGDINEARDIARRAVALAQPTDALADKADAGMALARVLITAGESEEGRAVASAAQELYAAKDHMVGVQRANELAQAPVATSERPLPAPVDVLGDRPPERFYKEFARRWVSRDEERLMELFAEDWVMTDRRRIPMWGEVRGREQQQAIHSSSLGPAVDPRFEINEVLACDDRVIAVRITWGGVTSAGGGEFALEVGAVSVVRDGQHVTMDVFDAEDRPAMIARYAELGGGQAPLGDLPPELFFREFCRRWAARDVDRILELYADGYVNFDHREVGWEEITDREGLRRFVESVMVTTGDIRCEVDEVLARDERLIAQAVTWRSSGGAGSGSLELAFGYVAIVEDGLIQRQDHYDHDDRQGMLARYRELGGQTPAAVAERPFSSVEECEPEDGVLGDRPSERVLAEIQGALHARDYERLAELVAEDCYLIDHRALGYDDAHGREQCVRDMRAAFDASPNIRLEFDEVLAADDRVAVTQIAFRGHGVKAGEFETGQGVVSLIEDGLLVGMDYYEPDDRPAMIARYAELGGGASGLGDRPPEQFFKKWLPLSAANDADALSAMLAEDFVRIDHRSIGWEPLRGREANVALWRSAYESAQHIRQEVDEVLACDHRVIAWRFSWRGVATGGPGEFATSVGQVCVIEDGLYRSCDQYDTDDRGAMLARYVELGGGLGKLGNTAPERLLAEYARRYARRDYEGVLELMSEDYVQVDHRKLGWTEIDKEQNAAEIRSVWAGTTDIRPEVEEVVAADDRVLACICTYRGSSDASTGGGQFEYPVGFLLVSDQERSSRVEWFDPDDRAAMVARYVELGGGLGMLGDTASERWFAEYARRYAARDLDSLLALIAEDWVQVDHRKIGWSEMDKDRLRDEMQATWDGATDIRVEVDEVLAADDRAFLGRCTYRGSATRDVGGGRLEYPVGFLALIDAEACTRVEWFDPEDRQAMLARYEELAALRAGS